MSSAGEVPDRKLFDLVSDRLDRGVDEADILHEVEGMGLTPKDARTRVHAVSLRRLAEGTRPEILRLLAERGQQGNSHFIAASLREKGVGPDEERRILRDIDAVETEIADGNAEMKGLAGKAIGAIVMMGIGGFRWFVTAMLPNPEVGYVPWIFLFSAGLGWLIYSGVQTIRIQNRITEMERILRPPADGSVPRPV